MRQASMHKKELKTQFSYNRLWKMLIDRNIQKQELQKMSEVSAASIAKMGRCEMLLQMCFLGYVKPLIVILKTSWNVFMSKKRLEV